MFPEPKGRKFEHLNYSPDMLAMLPCWVTSIPFIGGLGFRGDGFPKPLTLNSP